jgi:hypothetical protein
MRLFTPSLPEKRGVFVRSPFLREEEPLLILTKKLDDEGSGKHLAP